MTNSNAPTRTTYTITLYVITRWPTGSYRGTGIRKVQVEEDSTVLGGMRAIDEAVRRHEGDVLTEVHAPEIEPNPALMGWPIS